MRGAFFLVLMLWAAAGGAQTTYKCVNAQRAITYSNIPCEKQGLKDAGPVSDRTTTMPFVQPAQPEQKAAPRKETSKPAGPVIEKSAK
jgi:hypothetical protein